MDYFYGKESEMFSFYRIPKVLYTDDRFAFLSDSARALYGLMLDRMSLSRMNGWTDEKNRVYIIFTVQQIMELLRCHNQKVAKILAELDSQSGVGLIERQKKGLGKPDIIFVKNFNTDLKTTEITAHVQRCENHTSRDVINESRKSHVQRCENHTSEDVKNTSPESRKSHANKTNTNYIELIDTKSEERDALVEKSELTREEKRLFIIFLENRKSKGKPETKMAIDLLVQKLLMLGSDEIERIEILEKTILKGWLDLYPMDNGNPLGYQQDNSYN